MLPDSTQTMIQTYPITKEKAAEIVAEQHPISVVGHQVTADVFASELNWPVPFNRETVALDDRDALLVGQYRGPRLEEGAKFLPEGAEIHWVYMLFYMPDPNAKGRP